MLLPALGLLIWLMLAPEALAATFAVNTTGDAVDANTGDGQCLTAGGQCTLRAAIQQANALPAPPSGSPHLITLPVGTIRLTIAGRDETNSATGDLNVKVGGGGLQIVGQGATRSIVEAGASSTTGIDRVLRVQTGSILKLTKVTVRHGTVVASATARSGGGILDEGQVDLAEVEVRENSVANDLIQPGGGGIAIVPGAAMSLVQSTVADNTANSNGAGISNSGTLRLDTATIAQNTSSVGAAGGLFHDSTATTELRNMTLARNTAAAAGGGIAAPPGSPALRLANSILDNSSPANNCNNAVSITSEGFNLSSDATCPLVPTGSAPDQIQTTSKLSTFAVHGGETRNFVPLPGSRAIDAGAGASCGGTTTPDQRGLARPQSIGVTPNGQPACDIGAVEVPVLPVNATGDGPPVAVTSSSCAKGLRFGCGLRQAVVDANTLGGATITLVGATFTLTQAGRDEDAGLTGDLDVLVPITILSGSIQGSTIRGGTSQANSIDRIFDIRPGGELGLSDVTLQFGHAIGAGTAGDGGAIRAAGEVRLIRSVVRDSVADEDGGGIAISTGDQLRLENVEVRDNVAARNGGGISTAVPSPISLATIAGNRAGGAGGGILFNNQGQPSGTLGLALSYSTVSSNVSGLIGAVGIANRSDTTSGLERVTVVDNTSTAQVAPAVSLSGGSVTVDGSLFARNNVTNCQASNATLTGHLNLSDDASCNIGTNSRVNTDPVVGAIRDNGGSLRTNALLPGSPAIDAIPGDDSLCSTFIFDGDGRGATLLSGSPLTSFSSFSFGVIADGDDVAGASCDIGSFEVARMRVATTDDLAGPSASDGRCPGDTSTPCSLRAAVQAANAQGHAVVELPAGNYHLTIRGSNEDASATGDLDVTGGLTLLGASAATTTITSSNLDRDLEIRSGGQALVRRVTLTLDTVSFVTPLPESGGAILNRGTLDLADVSMFRNGASLSGGGLAATSGSTTTLKRVLFLSNASDGVGGGISADSGSTLTLENVTLSNNRARDTETFVSPLGGGGIWTRANSLTLTNVSLIGNEIGSGGTGGGILVVAGTTTVSNTLLQNNSEDCRVSGGTLRSLGHNISHDNSCATAFSATADDGDRTSTTIAVGPIADNGGQTKTHALLPPVGHPQPGNLAIDGGSQDTPLDGRAGRCAATDQRNLPRPRDGDQNLRAICDVGAFEVQSGGGVGTFDVKAVPPVVQPGHPVTVSFTWTVPAPSVWRSLESLSLRLVGESGQSAFSLHWSETTDRYALLDAGGHELAGGIPGSATILQTSLVSLALHDVHTQGSGPTGPSVTLTLPFVFAQGADDQAFTIQVSARNDQGVEEPFATAGTIVVGNPGRSVQQPPEDDHGKPDTSHKDTDDERNEREHGNRGGPDEHRTEGNVVEVHPDARPLTIVIGTRDGLVTLRLRGDAAHVSVKVGDYVMAEGEKVTEQLYEIDDLSVE